MVTPVSYTHLDVYKRQVKGSVVKQAGWRAVYGEEKEETTIPGWQDGDTLTLKATSITEGKTTPKPLHTCLLYTSACADTHAGDGV